MTRDELIDSQREEIKELTGKIAELEEKTRTAMGVGSGSGNLFVYGDYDSIKAAQKIVIERDQLRAELAALTAKLDASKFCANVADDLRAELAAIKAQEPVAELLRGQSVIGNWFDVNVFDLTAQHKTKLYAAPVAKQVVMPCQIQLLEWNRSQPEPRPIVVGREYQVAEACASLNAAPETTFCEYCGGNDEHPQDHCMDCARPNAADQGGGQDE